MGADQIAEISPLIRETLDAYAAMPAHSDVELCATLEIDGQPDAWVQFIYGTLNFAYPRQEAPAELLANLLASLPGWRVLSWEAGKFATVNFDGGTALGTIANAIDALFEQLFAPGDYAVNGRLDEVSRSTPQPGPPALIAIEHDDYHAKFVGKTDDGRQFFLTCPFVPAIRGRKGEEFVALYLFDKDGTLLEARIDTFGPRETIDLPARQALCNKHLADLAPLTYQRIEIAPFALDEFGTKFGLVLRIPEDEDDVWAVEVQPGNYMAFFEPWDSGEYDT